MDDGLSTELGPFSMAINCPVRPLYAITILVYSQLIPGQLVPKPKAYLTALTIILTITIALILTQHYHNRDLNFNKF